MTTPNDHNLPPAPTRGQPVSAATFDLLISAARKGGWPAVFKVFAEGEETNEPRPGGYIVKRPARRRTLEQFLTKRPDLKALIDSAAQERRDRLLTQLEDEVEAIALGPGDVTQDFGKNGQVTRTRVDRRNKLYAILQLLKAHDPDNYADRKRIDVAGRVGVDHVHTLSASPTAYTLNANEIMQLPPARAEMLFDLLAELEDIRIKEKKNGNERELIDAPARLLESSPELPETPSSQQPGD